MKSRLITLFVITLLLLTCVCVWKCCPDERESSEAKTSLKTNTTKKPLPPVPYAPLNKVTQGGDSEDHSWALDVADRIARERIALSSSDVQKLMSFIAGEKPI